MTEHRIPYQVRHACDVVLAEEEEKAEAHRDLAFAAWPRCVEYGRRFDLSDEMDAEEWAYGHDCEA